MTPTSLNGKYAYSRNYSNDQITILEASRTKRIQDKKLCDLLSFMKENVNRFPKLKAFLWTLDSRNINAIKYNISNIEELEEQTKLVNSFLKLAYWY